MSEEDNENLFFIEWPKMVIYVGQFAKVINDIEAKGCISKDLALETKKKISEFFDLIDVVTTTHDKDKQKRVEDLYHDIMTTLFRALDNCFEKYPSSEVK